jgi:hypothetical protein
MMSCPHTAALIITREVTSTSTEVARERIELSCSLAAGHEGPHHDETRDEKWSDRGEQHSHVIRHESEDRA